MTTLDVVSPKKKSEPSAEELAALELVRLAKEQGLSLTRPDGLLKHFTKSVLETAFNEEMTEDLGMRRTALPRTGSRPMSATGPTRCSRRWRPGRPGLWSRSMPRFSSTRSWSSP